MNVNNFSSLSVNVPQQMIWDVLIDRVIHPERYLTGILDSSIQKSGQVLIRKMRTTLGEIVERIVIDVKNKVITSFIVEHPEYIGVSVNKIIPIEKEAGFSLIAFIKNWKPKDPNIETHEFTSLKEELLVTKKIAEDAL